MTKPAEKILIVDDSDTSRLIYAGVIQKHYPGSTLELAESAEEGLRLFNEAVRLNQPHTLIITDYEMPPGLTGVELTRLIRANAQNMAVRIIGASGDNLRQQFMEAGANGFYLKGPRPRDLIKAIEESPGLAA